MKNTAERKLEKLKKFIVALKNEANKDVVSIGSAAIIRDTIKDVCEKILSEIESEK